MMVDEKVPSQDIDFEEAIIVLENRYLNDTPPKELYFERKSGGSRNPLSWRNELLKIVPMEYIVGEYVPLVAKGSGDKKRYAGLCPFHVEKTPSFYVVPRLGFFHCFGCGIHGNALDFLMQHLQLKTVAEATELLAQKGGIEIPRWYFSELRRMRQKRG